MSEYRKPNQVVIPDRSPKGEGVAWNDWSHCRKISEWKKIGVVASTILIEGATVVGSVALTPALLCLTPVIFGVAYYVHKRVDDDATQYWRNNWIEPYRNYSPDSDMKNITPNQQNLLTSSNTHHEK